MANIIINLPSLPVNRLDSVSTIAALRAIPSASLADGQDIAVDGASAVGDGGGGLFVWSELSTANDDGATIIRPTDTAPLAAGRWILTGADTFFDAFLGSDGAGKVGFSHDATYPAATIGRKGQQFVDPRDAPFNAVADGVNDDAAALQAALATGQPVWLQQDVQYAFGTLLDLSTARGFVGGGELIMLTGTGKFDAAVYGSGFAPNIHQIGLYAYQNTNLVIEAKISMQANAGIRTCSPVFIRECTDARLNVEVAGFKEAQYPLVAWDSNIAGHAVVYVHDCAADTDTLASMQITAFGIDYNRTNGNSRSGNFHVTARNLVLGATALAKYGRQTDAYNDQGQGYSGHTFTVISDTVDEPCDVFSDGNNGRVVGRQCYYGVKLIHGASFNTIDASIALTSASALVFGGSSEKEVTRNVVTMTAARVGDYLTATGTVAGVATDGLSATYKPTKNHVRGTFLGGSSNKMNFVVYEEAGLSNVFEVDGAGWITNFSTISNTAGTGANRSIIRRGKNAHVRAYIGTATSVTTATVVPFDTELLDDTGEYNPATGVFTANCAGRVLVTAKVRATALPAGKYLDLILYQNATAIDRGGVLNDSGVAQGVWTPQVSAIINLDAGDTVSVQAVTDAGAPVTVSSGSPANCSLYIEQI